MPSEVKTVKKDPHCSVCGGTRNERRTLYMTLGASKAAIGECFNTNFHNNVEPWKTRLPKE